jgi:Phosphotransferase system, mannose/fructose/N-acetylgalactosamine-specific component IIC
MIDLMQIVPIAVLGGVLGLDVVCFPQMMFSRPLVAATVAGAFVGDPARGILVGVAMELIALATLPFGASRYPEWGSAAVVAGAIAGKLPLHHPGVLTVALLAGLLTAYVGGWTLVKLRQWNAWLARRHRPALDAGARGTVIGLQLAGLTADLVRAAVVAGVMYALLFPLGRLSLERWTFTDSLSRAVVVSLASAVAASAAWTIFHSARHARIWFAGGLAVGLLLMLAA